ncbi:helix-turn-helix transcriptional regulator [Duganella violaceipulchra]|uniref:AlpA family phage regulatory protein n=1 Tax=Duganella violaceipulchra TaxID=2849652 RepID=A0AA41HGV2_9BURK|nr:AlpA family phage regulatory protein [Duganella violaceicalia]MBV6324887.1 AlpA family phage regulatory protein [Duganella violaceicalia]
MIRLPDVTEIYGLSRSIAYAKRGAFPAQVKLTKHASAWVQEGGLPERRLILSINSAQLPNKYCRKNRCRSCHAGAAVQLCDKNVQV